MNPCPTMMRSALKAELQIHNYSKRIFSPPPFSCGGPALWSDRPEGFVLTSAASVSAPPSPSPSASSGSTSKKEQCDTNSGQGN